MPQEGISQIESVLKSDAFQAHNGEWLDGGIESTPLWIRLTIENPLKEGGLLFFILQSPAFMLDEIEIFEPALSGSTPFFAQGRYAQINKRHRNLPVEINLKPETTQVFYLRLAAVGPLAGIPRLLTSDELADLDRRDHYLHGAYGGVSALILLLTLVLWVVIRERLYGYFSIFIFSNWLFNLDAYGILFEQGIDLDSGWRVLMLGHATHLCLVLFSHEFLQIKQGVARALYLTRAYIALYVCGMVLTAFGQIEAGWGVLFILNSSVVLVLFTLAIIRLRQGLRSARFYLLAFGLMSFITLGSILIMLGILEITISSTQYTVASLAESVFFSFAIVDRFFIMREEKFQAELRLVQERRRIARDLHDRVGSQINELLLQARQDPAQIQSEQLDYALKGVKDIVYLLNENNQPALDLQKDMQTYLQRMQRTIGNLELDMRIESLGPLLGDARSMHVQAIFLEWMSNLVQHAIPHSLNVHLIKKPRHIVLSIASAPGEFRWTGQEKKNVNDTGIAGRKGSGLDNIRIRSQILQAKCRALVLSGGTVFSIQIPLKLE